MSVNEAAARLRRGMEYAHCPDSCGECNDCRYIAAQLLDETPVDEAWLASVGFDDVHGCMAIKSENENCLSYLKASCGFFVQGRWIDIRKTRGVVRQLAFALGITLKP
jgi:hypothetical protein